MAARKWRLAAALASHLVKVMPEKASWWTQLAYAVRRSETIEKAEAILLEARAIHPRNVIIMLNLASYASVTGRTEEAKVRLRHAIDLDQRVRRSALDVKICGPCGIGSAVWSDSLIDAPGISAQRNSLRFGPV